VKPVVGNFKEHVQPSAKTILKSDTTTAQATTKKIQTATTPTKGYTAVLPKN
jgi:hypothetical protein